MKCAIGIIPLNFQLNIQITRVIIRTQHEQQSLGTKCFTKQIILNLETTTRKTYFQLILMENRETNKESEKRGQHSLIM